MKLLTFAIAVALILSAGCAAYSIRDVDVSNVKPACAAECKASYSACLPDADKQVAITEALEICKAEYEQCIKTCPAEPEGNQPRKEGP